MIRRPNFASKFCPKDELRGRDFSSALREKSYAFSLELYAVMLEVEDGVLFMFRGQGGGLLKRRNCNRDDLIATTK